LVDGFSCALCIGCLATVMTLIGQLYVVNTLLYSDKQDQPFYAGVEKLPK